MDGASLGHAPNARIERLTGSRSATPGSGAVREIAAEDAQDLACGARRPREGSPRSPLTFSRQNANPCVSRGFENACDARVMTSARDLSARLADLLRRERHALAEFLVALADFDRRRLWLDLGHASLFNFLHRELGLSKGAAYYRKAAAELV